MKSRTTIFLFLVCNLVFGQSKPSTDIIDASIRYHDPGLNWSSLNAEFLVVSERDSTRLILANNEARVEWDEILKDGRIITGGYQGDSCFVKLDGKSIEPKGEIENFLLDCPQIIGRSNYWLYMYGLPMKLQDRQAIIDPRSELVDFLGQQYWRIKVAYEGSIEGERWQFYFAPDTYRFAIAQYFHPALGDDSEYIVYDTPFDLHGMVLPARHSWYMYNKREFIGSEELMIRN